MKTKKVLFVFLSFFLTSFMTSCLNGKKVCLEEYGFCANIPNGWEVMPQSWVSWLNSETLYKNNFIGGLWLKGNKTPIEEPHMYIGYNAVEDIDSYDSIEELLTKYAQRSRIITPEFDENIELKQGYVRVSNIKEGTIIFSLDKKLIIWKLYAKTGGVNTIAYLALRPFNSGCIRLSSVFLNEPSETTLESLEAIFNSISIDNNHDIFIE